MFRATEAYFSEQNTLLHWIQDCCEVGADLADTNANLFGSWECYAKRQGEDPGSKRRFAAALEGEGYTSIKDTRGIRGRGFSGLRVRAAPLYIEDEH